jgi:branched-chain amino acid transport system substrate-binding protein
MEKGIRLTTCVRKHYGENLVFNPKLRRYDVKKISYPLIVLALISIMIFGLCVSSYAGEVRGVTKDTIKIGLITDMTGPAASMLSIYAHAHRDYFQWVNEHGGINGRKIKLIIEDDRYTIPAAIAAFKKLVYRDEVLCISGPGGTGQHTALFSQYEKVKMPSFAVSISPTIHTPYKRYVFASAGDYVDFTGMIYDFVLNKMKAKAPKIAMVLPDTEAGKVVAEGARKYASFYNQKYYGEVLNVGAVDATSQILRLKSEGVDNIVIAANITDVVSTVLRTCRRFNYSPNVHGVHFACGDEVIEMVGDTAKNYYGVHALSQWHDDTPEMKKVREVFKKYHPNSKPPIGIHQMGWLWGIIISEGLNRAGKDVDGEKLVDALETLRDFDTGGLCGPVTYTSKSHKATNNCKIFRSDTKNKRLVAITGWIKPPELKE